MVAAAEALPKRALYSRKLASLGDEWSNPVAPVHAWYGACCEIWLRGDETKIFPAVARGELHVAFGVTEPDGTDTTSIKTAARKEGDHYIVRGRKVWTTKALQSERVYCLRARRREMKWSAAPMV